MSKFTIASSGRRLGSKLGRSKHVYACESASPLLLQERTVSAGPHKGCVEIFTEINGTEYYLDRYHKNKEATNEVCFYKGVEGPAPRTNGRNINQFWTKTAFEDGFLLSPAAAPHQFVCFGEDGVLHLRVNDADLFHASFIAEAPAPAPNPEVVAAVVAPAAAAPLSLPERLLRLENAILGATHADAFLLRVRRLEVTLADLHADGFDIISRVKNLETLAGI